MVLVSVNCAQLAVANIDIASNTCVHAKSVLQSLQHSSYDIIFNKSG